MGYDRISLPNGCSCSKISVTPSNWKQLKKISGVWRINYRFYDPSFPKPKQVNLKAMNKYTSLIERKEAVTILINNELQMLRGGYNPFYKKVVTGSIDKYDIENTTLFIPALYKALTRVKLEPSYHKHIMNYIIPNVEKAALHLGYSLMYINEVKRKHIIFILDHLREVNSRFSDNTFNRFRTDLKILFRELALVDVIEHNIISDIPVKQVEIKEKSVLSTEERTFVNDLLEEKYPTFHRYLNIFFHSGARSSELLRIKGSDVDLPGQRYKTQIRKGKKYRSVWRTIKNIALPFWVEAVKGCGSEDYVFSKGLKPGAKPIQPYQIHKRWTRLIKNKEFEINGKKVKVEATFYSLKHSNTTETVDLLNEQAAADLNAHTTTGLVKNIYDTKAKNRQHEKLKKLNNKFA